ncbi:MAG: O-antigen ligase family protein [Lentisphaerae bacterium]|nr:O-antigen ligase family protein [Lentisphaerota bacterium]
MAATTKTQRALESVARRLVLTAVVVSPWLFGGAEPWAYLLLGLVVTTGVGFWLFAGICARRLRLRAVPVCGILGLLALLLIAQITPLPAGVVQRLSPLAGSAGQTSLALMDQLTGPSPEAAESAPRPATTAWSTLSLSAPATTRSLMLFLIYAGTFLVLANTVREWSHLRRAAALLVGSAFIMAVLAVVHKFSGSEEIYWFHTPRYGGNIFGPFSNRNHLAAYLNMTVGLSFGLLLSSRRFYQVMAWPDMRERIAMLSSREGAQTTLRAFMALIIMGAVAVSLSRGAILSLALTTTLFGTLILWRRRSGTRILAGFILPMLIMIATLLWFGQTGLIERIGTLTDVMQNPFADLRFIVSDDCLRMVGNAPLTGIGFGSFKHVYAAFQTPPLRFRWLHAHNDWVQLLVEGGVIGAFLFALALVLWLRHLQRRWPLASDAPRIMVIGILFGLTTLALHSLIDYSLHKPANALLLAALAGMAVAGIHLRRGHRPNVPALPGTGRAGATAVLAIAAFPALVYLLVALNAQLRGTLAAERVAYMDRYLPHAVAAGNPAAALEVGLADARSVLRRGGEDPDTLMAISGTLLAWAALPDLPDDLQERLVGSASQAAIDAVRGAPVDYLGWVWFARIQMALSHWDAADLALQRARQLVQHPKQVQMFDIPDAPDNNRQIP